MRDEPQASSILNLISARVIEVGPCRHPAQVLVRLDASGTPLLASITRRSARALALQPGQQVCAQVKAAAVLA
jgi:molybdate transport system ATP-binding protein